MNPHQDKQLLFVDLDNTLTRTDLFLEPLLRLIKSDLSVLFLLPIWLAHGRGYLKEQIAQRLTTSFEDIPYIPETLEYIKLRRNKGHRIILATASNRSFAEKIADHLGLFDQVIASSQDLNIKGLTKLAEMKRVAAGEPFDYLGDSHVDIKIWNFIGHALVVSPQAGVLKRLQKQSISYELITGSSSLKDFIRALRPYQWAKNLLIFIPLVLAQKLFQPLELFHAILAFISFSFCASAGYLVNDLFDLGDDRKHPKKKFRPIPSGAISIWDAVYMIVALVVFSLLIAVSLSSELVAVLLVYLLITFVYSLILKQKVIVDVLVLAGLYTLRIIAGGVAIQVPVSFWLLTFSVFIFLSLALLKRCMEFNVIKDQVSNVVQGRGYQETDVPLLYQMGIASGYLSIIVIALYINSPDVADLFASPQVLWLVCPLTLYWISRMWLKVSRHDLKEDPVLFALRDKISLVTAGLLGLVIMLATV